jgi:hypothetical protein
MNMKANMKTIHLCPPGQRCSDFLSVRLEPTPLDERVVFVHSVCGSLIDSRFGPGRTSPLLYHFIRNGEVYDFVIFDMTPAGPVPSYTILPDSEIARRHAFAAFQNALYEIVEDHRAAGAAVHKQNTSPPWSTRGSP